PVRRRAVLLDGVDQLAVAALVVLHGDLEDRHARRDEPRRPEKPADNEADHPKENAKDRREGLSVQQQAKRRQEEGENVDHRRASSGSRAGCSELRACCKAGLNTAGSELPRVTERSRPAIENRWKTPPTCAAKSSFPSS